MSKNDNGIFTTNESWRIIEQQGRNNNYCESTAATIEETVDLTVALMTTELKIVNPSTGKSHSSCLL
uniref:Uncharacterized protein n=1 Tax=Heterorhabditis bacteriophora TaxID=37862 RepID=A0A1I7X578_HETBA